MLREDTQFDSIMTKTGESPLSDHLVFQQRALLEECETLHAI